MALVIEDGSLVDGADSWAARVEYIAYAASVGVTISSNSSADEELVSSARFICSKESELKGTLIERDQALCFPRYDLTVNGWPIDSDEISPLLKKLQMELALDLHSGIDIYNVEKEVPPVVEKRIEGAIDIKYASPKGASSRRRITRSRQYLNMFLKDCNYGISVERR